MNTNADTLWIAFARTKRVAIGAPRDVATAIKAYIDDHSADHLLIFDANTSLPVELDLRGSLATILKRLPHPIHPTTAPQLQVEIEPAAAGRSAGRPKLGVTAREVTLLPRHWEWLATQPGGASVALRKLVEEARRSSKETDRKRGAQEAAYRFMSAMAGDNPHFEEATRALFADDCAGLQKFIAKWPRDIRSHTLALAQIVAGNELSSAQ